MRVCIIGHTERNYLPYMEKYVQFLKRHGVEYDIVCWQREERPRAGSLDYYEKVKPGVFNKIASYRRFKRHVVRILEKNRYDKLIVLTTMPAIFLRKVLFENYKGKYLFDFRDYSFERFPLYRRIVDRLIGNSGLTTISSLGFMEFLSPNDKIIMNHNFTNHEPAEFMPDLRQKQVINIGFIGGVRYYDENTFLIEQLKNTFRYQLWYIGQPHPDCDLPGYCAQNEVTNVSFVGKYDNSQKPELYKSIDIINSIYGDDSLEVTTALPNRLYEACLFKKPIISSKGTYLGQIIEQYHLGLSIDVEQDDVRKILDDYIDNFDREAFLEGCRRFLNVIKADELRLQEALAQFILEK